MSTFEKGPVPQFRRCNNVDDLEPRINSQPPFRRANPEGGFISVGALKSAVSIEN